MSRVSTSSNPILVGLAGQQNAGKSTIFNMLTGANQHIANYPGVTVDKKYGSYRHDGNRVEIVDLPGTYSLSSFSLEERVARNFLLEDKPHVLANVVDASSLRRSLCFTLQLLEMEIPLVLVLNMMDVANRAGAAIDLNRLQHRLGVDVVPTIGRKREGKEELRQAIHAAAIRREGKSLQPDYDKLEKELADLRETIEQTNVIAHYPSRWLAVKLIEGDEEILGKVEKRLSKQNRVLEQARQVRDSFFHENDISTSDYMAGCRSRLAGDIVDFCVIETRADRPSLSDLIDRVVLNRFAAPVILIATVFTIYQLSIVKGYDLTHYWWPILASFRSLASDLLPAAGMLDDPYIRSMGLWIVDSANALLNYIPIFLILFSLIAILEDSGYMARIAFILDKLFHAFGLHGQSTLPFILGGVFAGGCAVPGVMSTKGIPDEQSRMATILTVPYMNCLAKIPFYVLLVNVFFASYKSWAMLFLSTITIFFALLIARLLTATVLRSMETAPFVMELPRYHLPTFFGVAQRAIERTWQYIKKVGTIVVAVSVCVFTLLQFPGLSEERREHYLNTMEQITTDFRKKIADTVYAEQFADDDALLELANLYTNYRTARLNAGGAEGAASVDQKFQAADPELFLFLRPADKDTKAVSTALRQLDSKRKTLRRQIKEEQIVSSFLGMVGRSLEPVTQWAGFNWKVNVAILASFAARESSVATIGVLYQDGAEENKSLEERISEETKGGGFTPLHALAIMVFFALYPPCLATTIMIKVQTDSYKWMLFSILFPTALGLVVASAIYTGGSMLGLSGIQMMAFFYLLVVALAIVTGLHKTWSNKAPAIVRLPDFRAEKKQAG